MKIKFPVLIAILLLSFIAGRTLKPHVSRSIQATIVGDSMLPTLTDGDKFILDTSKELKAGDIVVFIDPVDGGYSGKRLIALEGDIVEFHKRGYVYVNGKLLDEHYLYPDTKTYTYAVSHYTVPPNHVFVLGDNRPVSADSREYGSFPRKNIIGKIIP